MLAASLIVKNEEAMLENALKSIQGVDEIVICDTGSTDNTVEIAKKYTDKVFTDYVWQDDFAGARNHGLAKCTEKWRLIIDADEQLEDGGIDKIKKELENIEPEYDSLVFTIDNRNGGISTISRVIRDDVIYTGRAHNLPMVKKSKRTDIRLYYGFSPAHNLDPDRTLRILKKMVDDNPEDSRALYYLAREYTYKRNWKMAIVFYERYIKFSTSISERADAYLMLSRCYWNTKNGDLSRENCLKAMLLNPNFREAIIFMSKIVWPSQAKRWQDFATGATNEGVLFIREG
jgi:glycosyltransferase involved in cell wall biosynthesis